MKYLIFETYNEAISAEAVISSDLGYPKPGLNAATGELQPEIRTLRWAIPQQITDGRWVFPSPDNQGIEAELNWWGLTTDQVL